MTLTLRTGNNARLNSEPTVTSKLQTKVWQYTVVDTATLLELKPKDLIGNAGSLSFPSCSLSQCSSLFSMPLHFWVDSWGHLRPPLHSDRWSECFAHWVWTCERWVRLIVDKNFMLWHSWQPFLSGEQCAKWWGLCLEFCKNVI